MQFNQRDFKCRKWGIADLTIKEITDVGQLGAVTLERVIREQRAGEEGGFQQQQQLQQQLQLQRQKSDCSKDPLAS